MSKKIFIGILFFLLMLFLWQMAEDSINRSRLASGRTGLEAFVPSPVTIFNTFGVDGAIILDEVSITLVRAFSGFFLGFSLAIFMVILFIVFPFVRDISFPVAFALNSFPIVGFSPLIILAFGQGSSASIIFIAMMISYFPILVSLDASFRETDRELIDMMRVFNASRLQIIVKAFLPQAMPYLLMSMKLAIPASIIGAMMGEWLGSRNGIGQIVTISLYQLKPGLLYASLFSVATCILFFLLILHFLEKKLFPWRRK